MFSNKFKSDFSSLFNNMNNMNQQTVPVGYPCSFDSDCASPSICQFNVCTINIGNNDVNYTNICKDKSIKDCAKEMQKERENTPVPIYIPDIPISSFISNTGNTGNNGNINIPTINMNTPSLCKYDNECNKTDICISGVCVNKSNFPLIAKQRKPDSIILQREDKENIYTRNKIGVIQEQKVNDYDVKKYIQYPNNTKLDNKLTPYDYMLLLEPKNVNKQSILNGLHDDYFYFNN